MEAFVDGWMDGWMNEEGGREIALDGKQLGEFRSLMPPTRECGEFQKLGNSDTWNNSPGIGHGKQRWEHTIS
jgi:hypothetical protein